MWLIPFLSKKGGTLDRCKHSGHPISFVYDWFRDGPIRAMNSHGPPVENATDI